ncbi:hypothetical protein [Brucella intermedia]|uniref:hypothetical protein n=1 Tax=Brucella intermedia TaxID=94625 RepID=UPI0023616B30|nr:hypothetical protein [Brucella intermedia]
MREEARQRNKEWRMANKDAVRRHLNNYRKKHRKKHLAACARQRENINADPERRAHRAAVRKAWEERTGYTRPVPSKEQEQRRQALRYQRRKTRSLARERPEILRLAIQKLLPGYLIPSARMDVVNSVMELALANRVRHDGLADTVRECVTAHNRQYDYFKTVSIDAPITGTDGLTRADLIDSETFHF